MSETQGDNLFDHAWGKLIGGGALFGVGYYFDSLFTSLEAGEVDSVEIHWLVALAYENFGHTMTVGALFAAGGVALLFGLKQLVSGE